VNTTYEPDDIKAGKVFSAKSRMVVAVILWKQDDNVLNISR